MSILNIDKKLECSKKDLIEDIETIRKAIFEKTQEMKIETELEEIDYLSAKILNLCQRLCHVIDLHRWSKWQR